MFQSQLALNKQINDEYICIKLAQMTWRREIELLADNRAGVNINHVRHNKNVFWLEVSVKNFDAVEVLESLCDVQCTKNALPTIEVCWDDIWNDL